MPTTDIQSTRDEFAILEEMVTPGGGPVVLKEIFKAKNVKAFAKLCLKDPSRFEAIHHRLQYLGATRSKWRAAVMAVAKKSAEDRAKEVADEKLDEALQVAREAGKAVIDKGRPVDIAKAFVATMRPHLIYVGGQWLGYRGTCWTEVEPNGIRAEVQNFMDGGIDINTGEKFVVGPREVDHVVDALKSECFRESTALESRCWLHARPRAADPRMVMSATNGLLDIEWGHLMPHTADFFTRNAVGFAYDAKAPAPVGFLAFLESIWPERGVSLKEAGANRQNKATLQEIMGHLLTGETKYQKIFLFLGASRGGKGVLTRLITKLLGPANVASLNAAKLGAQFGLKSLIGKQLMVVADFRLGRHAQNTTLMIERLLNISGEDSMSIDRKFMDDWEGKLGARIILASNMEVVLPDDAGALLNRLIPLVFTKSFADNPDLTLEGRLETELPSILNWALDGLRRLEARVDAHGRPLGFIVPPAGEAALGRIARQGSTVKAFLDEMCVRGRGEVVAKTDLYEAFGAWIEDNELEDHYDEVSFSKELYAASGYAVESGKRRVEGELTPHYIGVALRA